VQRAAGHREPSTTKLYDRRRRGLGSNLYCLGVPDIVIQRILRHANVSTTATYYIKTAAADVRDAMERLQNQVASSVAEIAKGNGGGEQTEALPPTVN
jgi:integrase